MLILLLFFCSGLASLMLETVFRRDLTLITGNAVTATSLTLAAFLGGLALGARVFGAAADRSTRPLRLYGMLELAAAGSSAVVLALLTAGRGALAAPVAAIGPGWAGRILESTIAIALLVPPAAFMGGTLPALVRHASAGGRGLLPALARLYAVNTFGAAVGTALAGFILFEAWGIARTGGLAVALAALAGIAALALDRGPHPAPDDSGRDEGGGGPVRSAAAVSAALGGAAALGCEVVWTRLLALPLRSYAYSFSLMLTLFLIGIVLGASLLTAVSRRVSDPMTALGIAQVAAGLWVAGSVLWIPSLLAVPQETRDFGAFLLNGFLRGSPVVLPATILSGMALPLAIKAYGAPRERTAGAVGAVYAANTGGAIAGALLTAFVLIPWLGASRSLAILAALSALAGAVALRPRAWAWAPVAACAAVVLVPPSSYATAFATAGRRAPGDLLFYREGTTDTVAVVRRDYGFHDEDAKSEIVNGIAMTATVKPVWRYMAAEGHLPALFAPSDARALVICVGTGITLGAVSSHEDIPGIDAVDLSEGVLAALPVFARENGAAASDPRVRIVHDDGRHALSLSPQRYGLITLEPPPPIVAGSVHLYTLDFYRACRAHLVPGGVVAQWLPLHAQSLGSARALARTFLEAFPDAQLWLPSIRDAVLIGSDRPFRLEAERLRDAWANPRTRANLEAAYLETPPALLGTFLLDRSGIAAWTAGADLITDDRPWMEFFHRYGPMMGDQEIATLLTPSPGAYDWLDDASLRAEAEAERRAHLLYIRSEVTDDPAAQRQAATASRASRFGRYRMGCDTTQLESLRRLTPEDDWRRRVAACERMFGAAL